MDTISAVIITRDEAHNLPRCLSSVKWCREIVVVDTGSTDETREIAWEAGATVYEITWEGYGPAKRFAVDKATSSWVLSLDADEECPPELRDEICDILNHETSYNGYYVPRLTSFLGSPIRHCGWYPNRVLRLFRRECGNFTDAAVHEKAEVTPPIGNLKADLHHYSFPTLEHYLEKSNKYTTLGAEEAFRSGRRATLLDLIIRPPWSFISHYLFRRGFLDGSEGFLVSLLSATAVLTKYSKLRFLQRQKENR
ncbi:MAG: glycosyltransferase family 2 protein [bacterium]